MGFDGAIRIESHVDSRGFNQGIRSMMGAVGRLALAIGAAFGIAKITQFAKTAVDEASAMASALVGLESVVTGTGNSFTQAQEFIKSFVADGLVPAKDAITAYKNLLLRGYDTSQIEKTLIALKDSAAFGRQGQLDMGTAIARATEGLKNENSILVDNAGVTKNVAQMWKDYAKSIGTTTEALTKQQKIQAEVAGILEETRFQTGDAAKAANTYAGQVSALSVSFLNMKIALGNVLIPILTKIIPYIRAAIDALTIFFNRLATVVSIFFGVSLKQAADGTAGLAENSEAAAGAQGDLAKNTEKAGKAAKGALAAFDQLDVLQRQTAEGAADAGAGGPGGGFSPIDTAGTDTALQTLTDKVSAFKEKLLVMLGPAIAAFNRLKEALEPLGKTIMEGLGWAWENILVPFGKWVITSFIPQFFDLLAASARFLNAVLIALAPVLDWLWNNIFKKIAVGALNLVIELMKQFTNNLDALADWLNAHPDIFISIVESAQKLWTSVRLFAIAAWEGTVAIWRGASTWFTNSVINPMRAAFQTFVSWLQTIWQQALQGLASFARSPINTIIGFLNGMLRAMVTAVNRVADSLRNFRISLPPIPLFGFPGVNFSGANIPHISAPSIPYLATGAVIPPNSQFAAILGDQKSGRNLEAPEGLIRQIIQEELQKVPGREITINFAGNLGALVRELKPYIDKEERRLGIVSGA